MSEHRWTAHLGTTTWGHGRYILDEHGRMVAFLGDCPLERAQLLAAAPKLLAALKECLEQLSHEGLDRVPAAIHAREVIREAKGE